MPEEQAKYAKNIDNLKRWNAMSRPPAEALKEIKGGRLKGMSSIDPEWRIKILTEVFGPCGEGWYYEIVNLWLEPCANEQVIAFAQINLFVCYEEAFSRPIPGVGGSMLTAKETSGLYSSDEAYKMAITDAISVASKQLGVAADVYMGKWDGSKYNEIKEPEYISDEQVANIEALMQEVGADLEKFVAYYNIGDISEIPADKYESVIKTLERKRNDN